MTTDQLAAVTAALDAATEAEAANWPLGREQARALLRLARAAQILIAYDPPFGGLALARSDTVTGARLAALDAALLALAPNTEGE